MRLLTGVKHSSNLNAYGKHSKRHANFARWATEEVGLEADKKEAHLANSRTGGSGLGGWSFCLVSG